MPSWGSSRTPVQLRSPPHSPRFPTPCVTAGDVNEASSGHAAFVDTIPKAYDQFLGPLLFAQHASVLTRRLRDLVDKGSVLELAAGTGILTRTMRDSFPSNVRIVATDLNEPMLDCARSKFKVEESVSFSLADATKLPQDDGSFEAVACQFGFMFFPDKDASFRECLRVLKPGGVLLFNVWDSLDRNELCHIAHTTIVEHFPDDPPSFYLTPFGFNDRSRITSMLSGAGFARAESEVVAGPGESPSPDAAARAVTDGSPVSLEILKRDPRALPEIKAAITAKLRRRFGEGPIRPQTQAILFAAVAPK